MIITDADTRRQDVADFERRRDGVIGSLPWGNPNVDVFDVLCNDLVRLELHVSQAIERLKMMAGTRSDLTRQQRMLVRSQMQRLEELHACCVRDIAYHTAGRKGLEQTFGHLGDRERIS
jgi:hypothetical protein